MIRLYTHRIQVVIPPINHHCCRHYLIRRCSHLPDGWHCSFVKWRSFGTCLARPITVLNSNWHILNPLGVLGEYFSWNIHASTILCIHVKQGSNKAELTCTNVMSACICIPLRMFYSVTIFFKYQKKYNIIGVQKHHNNIDIIWYISHLKLVSIQRPTTSCMRFPC